MGMKYIISDPEIRGGMPVIKETRFPVTKILMELAEGFPIDNIAKDYGYDPELFKNVIMELASVVDEAMKGNFD